MILSYDGGSGRSYETSEEKHLARICITQGFSEEGIFKTS